jgi:hypothetical protein
VFVEWGRAGWRSSTLAIPPPLTGIDGRIPVAMEIAAKIPTWDIDQFDKVRSRLLFLRLGELLLPIRYKTRQVKFLALCTARRNPPYGGFLI